MAGDYSSWPDAARPGVPMEPDERRRHWLQNIQSGEWVLHLWSPSLREYANNGDQFGPRWAADRWRYGGVVLAPAEVAARVEAAQRKGYADAEADHQRRLEARFFAALPVFVSDPGRQHWPMTSVKAARECAERAAHVARREGIELAAFEARGWAERFGWSASAALACSDAIRALLKGAPRTTAHATPDPRNPDCVARWPDCSPEEYDPRCCRFPKSCSCENVATGAREPGRE